MKFDGENITNQICDFSQIILKFTDTKFDGGNTSNIKSVIFHKLT